MTDQDKSSPPNIGDMIARIVEIRDEKSIIKSREKELNEELELITEELLERFEEQGTTGTTANGYSANISEVEVPTAVDWDKIYEYIEENNAAFILERRISSTAWRELKQSGELIPGTDTFTKRGINVRKSGN